MRFRRYKIQIGIDIEKNHIRAVKLTIDKNSFHIESEVSKNIDCTQTTIIEALKNLRHEEKYGKNSVITALSHDSIFKTTLSLETHLNEKKFERYIQNNAMNHWRRQSEDIYYDYEINTCADNTYNIITVQRKEVEILQQYFKESGLRLRVVDVDLFALGRLLPCLDYKYVTRAIFVLIRNQKMHLCAFDHHQWVGALSIDYLDPASDIMRALQLFYQAYPDCTNHAVFTLNINATVKNQVIPRLNTRIHSATQLNEQSWLALALALWGYSHDD